MGYCMNGCDTGGIPMYLIEEFLKEVKVPIIVETGTAFGESIKLAANYFDECYTIELSGERGVQNKLINNINFYKGNTIDVLPQLITHFNHLKEGCAEGEYNYVLWWLDAHFDGDKPADSLYKDCYLLEELDIISEYSQDSIIIIDDARLFMGYPPHPNNPNEWPTIQQIFSKFQEKFPYFFVTIVDDYVLAIPDRLEWIFQREWMARFSIRYPNDADKLKTQVKDVYSALKKYIQ